MIGNSQETVYLRALNMSDLERTLQWHNDPELYKTLGGTFRPVSRSTEEEWLRNVISASPRNVNLAICARDGDEHIGNLYLRDIDWVSRRCELHLLIGAKKHQSRGFGKSAIRLIKDYAFGELGLRRLYLEVLADNAVAVQVYEKCGFQKEGCLRSHVFKAGTFKDVLLMGLVAETNPQ
jgi:RimJ/RimL family protein N-acetyltransferase